MSSTKKTTEPTAFSPGLQDDKALRLYLLQDRNDPPGQHFFDLAIEKILSALPTSGQAPSSLINDLSLAFATFLDDLRNGHSYSTLPQGHLWQQFLKYLLAVNDQVIPPKQLRQLYAPYFARDVLLRAISLDKNQVFTALSEAYREPARQMVHRYFKGTSLSFDDVYHEALINLIEKPPLQDKVHTAQLYSMFRTIVYRRAVDQLGKDRFDNDFPFPDEVPPNPTDYIDYIIDSKGLNERFSSDDAGEILAKALQNLKEGCNKILNQRFYFELKFREIAVINGWSPNDVGSRISRCLKKLRKLLDQKQD